MRLIDYINSESRGYILPFMGTNGLFITGDTYEEVCRSPKKQMDLAKVMDEGFGSDFIYALDYGGIFCKSLGMKMLTPDFDFPSVLEHMSDEEIKGLQMIHPEKDDNMKSHLQSVSYISDSFEKPFFLSIPGPFTTAVNMVGAIDISRKIIRDAAFVEYILEYTTEMVKRYAVAAQNAGARFISIAEPSSVILSPKRFEKYVVPAVYSIYGALHCWKGLHICGDTTNLIGGMIEMGPECISFDQIMDLQKIAKAVPSDIVIAGNIDPIEVLGKVSPEEVEKNVAEIVESMKKHDNFLAAFGCTCLNSTPAENMKVAIAAARRTY